ncbi:MAG: hypothetical protein HY038_08805 [Nitrospirae bacterium]|nr:hypothetical protein [Nitrospirota bacterium]
MSSVRCSAEDRYRVRRERTLIHDHHISSHRSCCDIAGRRRENLRCLALADFSGRSSAWHRRDQQSEARSASLGRTLHDSSALANNKPNPAGPAGSAKIAAEGSAAAFVPVRRALSWQLTNPQGTPVARVRYWGTFKPGEVRVCTSCHGNNDKDQAGQAAPTNQPQVLLELLQYWKAQNP